MTVRMAVRMTVAVRCLVDCERFSLNLFFF
jgi:hypothetical protein